MPTVPDLSLLGLQFVLPHELRGPRRGSSPDSGRNNQIGGNQAPHIQSRGAQGIAPRSIAKSMRSGKRGWEMLRRAIRNGTGRGLRRRVVYEEKATSRRVAPECGGALFLKTFAR
jgi:hypothetical protein